MKEEERRRVNPRMKGRRENPTDGRAGSAALQKRCRSSAATRNGWPMKAKSYPVRDRFYLSSHVHRASKSPLPRPVRVGERAGLSVVRGDSGNDVRQNVAQDRTAPHRNAAEDLGHTVLTTRRGRARMLPHNNLRQPKPKLHAQLTLSPTLTCRGRGDFDFPSFFFLSSSVVLLCHPWDTPSVLSYPCHPWHPWPPLSSSFLSSVVRLCHPWVFPFRPFLIRVIREIRGSFFPFPSSVVGLCHRGT
jgi:hypothetical protein